MVKVIKIGEDEETKVAENVTSQEPVIDEEPATTELDGYKIRNLSTNTSFMVSG